MLDEVASLQRLPALPALLERGRKHGVSVVLGPRRPAHLESALAALEHPVSATEREELAALFALPKRDMSR